VLKSSPLRPDCDASNMRWASRCSRPDIATHSSLRDSYFASFSSELSPLASPNVPARARASNNNASPIAPSTQYPVAGVLLMARTILRLSSKVVNAYLFFTIGARDVFVETQAVAAIFWSSVATLVDELQDVATVSGLSAQGKQFLNLAGQVE